MRKNAKQLVLHRQFPDFPASRPAPPHPKRPHGAIVPQRVELAQSLDGARQQSRQRGAGLREFLTF